ncbi:MAG: DUF1727 domain-containing protein, partial [Eggerthellaceae bacterium]|nr:DUF1727 domain-containing protein [Eggerthellaceae bacterium]
CPRCGYKHHELDFAVTAVRDKQEKSCTLSVRANGAAIDIPANVRAGYDIYNAIAAFAGLTTLCVPEHRVASALGHFTHAAHRFEVFDVNGTETRLLLMKNTAGCNQLINMLVSEPEPPRNLVCLLGNEVMDGLSTDWIVDVRWEKLVTPDTKAIVGGPCFDDMAARLLVAGLDESKMRIQTDYPALVQDIASMDEPVTVIANCSTIEALRLKLVKDYKPIDYWTE